MMYYDWSDHFGAYLLVLFRTRVSGIRAIVNGRQFISDTLVRRTRSKTMVLGKTCYRLHSGMQTTLSHRAYNLIRSMPVAQVIALFIMESRRLHYQSIVLLRTRQTATRLYLDGLLLRMTVLALYTVALKPIHAKITRSYLRYFTVPFCYVHKTSVDCLTCVLVVKLHPHRVKLHRIKWMRSGLVMAKSLT